jgi:hypothetical protein
MEQAILRRGTSQTKKINQSEESNKQTQINKVKISRVQMPKLKSIETKKLLMYKLASQR